MLANAQQDKQKYYLKAEGIPPAFVSFADLPKFVGAAPVEMTLPFPAKGCLALDANGCTLDKNITLHDLLGFETLLLFGKNGDPTRFSLELHLRSKVGYRHGMNGVVIPRGEHPSNSIFFYSLREHIENLLSLETGIGPGC
ncbi:hypothetical protein QU731_23715 [Klebsiella pneumoniae]|nr:hypothetical protein QU731_23715 [Klebsiella pneumoniae]